MPFTRIGQPVTQGTTPGWRRPDRAAIPGDVRLLTRKEGPVRPQRRPGYPGDPPTPPHRPAPVPGQLGHGMPPAHMPTGYPPQAPAAPLPPRMNLPVKNTFIEFPDPETPSRGDAPTRIIGSCPSRLENKENVLAKKVPQMPSPMPFMPPGLQGHAGPMCVPSTPATPAELAALSVGSALHGPGGQCKPCAWFHHAKGCQRGTQCEFCHACPPGEIKRRKKEKYRIIRERRTEDAHA